MDKYLKRANELEKQMQEDRHYLHENAESGMILPNTTAYVKKRLHGMGLEVTEVSPSGLIALIEGKKPGKTILLRADMDALPMKEENELPFQSKTNAAHNCGHDLHTSMLLGAAQILKEHQNELCGSVKLMFQPGEEVFQGAKNMIAAGVLENPSVDAAISMHVVLDTAVPSLNYGTENSSASCDGFKLIIHGCGSHGAMPQMGIDPINVGMHIYSAFQNLIAREIDPAERVSLTFGSFQAGTTPNIIPAEAILMGTLRTFNPTVREKLVKRMHEICDYTGKTYGVTVDYEVLSAVPTVYTDPQLATELAGYVSDLAPNFITNTNYKVTASDDVAFITEKVPAVHFMIGCKVDGCKVQHHNPAVLFDEHVLPYGAAVFAKSTILWLQNH